MWGLLLKLLGGVPAKDRAGVSMDCKAIRWEIPPSKT
jgi:hypothetical protein